MTAIKEDVIEELSLFYVIDIGVLSVPLKNKLKTTNTRE